MNAAIRRLALTGAAILLSFQSVASDLEPPRQTGEAKRMTSTPSISRPPPPSVPPVVRDGISYEQAMGETGQGSLGGVLVAKDAATGAVLWHLTVYEIEEDPDAPGPMGLYFKAMTLSPDGRQLLVEDEADRRFTVDLETRTVTGTSPAEPEVEDDDEPVPPKPKP